MKTYHSNELGKVTVPDAEPEFKIRMDKHYSTWSWRVGNPQGGGFGSSDSGPKWKAMGNALRSVPTGATYQVTTNGKTGLVYTRGQEKLAR